jgi:hypothetical protein
MENVNEKIKYESAKNRVKKIKEFYIHLLVYLVINIFLLVVRYQNLEATASFFEWKNFTTLFFWGIGLFAHAASVFGPDLLLGKNWEERKIREFMDKEKNNNWEK